MLRQEIGDTSLPYAWPSWPWHLLIAVASVDAVWLMAGPATLDRTSAWTILALLGFAIGVQMLARSRPVSDRVHVFAVGLSFMLLAWPALRIQNYAAMSIALPLKDARHAALDRALGFDSWTYLRFMDQRPTLLMLTDWAYQGLTLYCMVAFFVLLAAFGAKRARDFILMFFVAAVVTSATGFWLPALGPMVHYGFNPAEFQHIRFEHATWAVETLLKVRQGVAHTLSLNDMPGLTSVPSFHTAMGLICIFCCRGNLPLFAAAWGVNTLMIAATPVFGAHYFVDLIAGTCLACFAIVMVAWPDLRLISGGKAAWPARP